MRSAGQQAAAERAGELQTLLGTRVGDFETARGAGVGENWVGCVFGDFEGAGIYCFAGGASVWAWGGGGFACGGGEVVRGLSSEPAEHVDGEGDVGDVCEGFGAGEEVFEGEDVISLRREENQEK